MRPDKKKVVDEVWDDERVKSFLRKAAPNLPGEPDFHVLVFAYQSMRADDFGRFLGFYLAEGRDVAAKDGNGGTLAQYLVRHAQAKPYIALLEAAARKARGAQAAQ